MVDAPDIFPSWSGLKDNLWAAGIVAAVTALGMALFSRHQRMSAKIRFWSCAAASASLAVFGQAVIYWWGPWALLAVVPIVASPYALLIGTEAKKPAGSHDAVPPAGQPAVTPVLAVPEASPTRSRKPDNTDLGLAKATIRALSEDERSVLRRIVRGGGACDFPDLGPLLPDMERRGFIVKRAERGLLTGEIYAVAPQYDAAADAMLGNHPPNYTAEAVGDDHLASLEISFGPSSDSNFVNSCALVAGDGTPALTWLSGHIEDLRLTNNTQGETEIVETWIEIDGERPKEVGVCEWEADGVRVSTLLIGSRRLRTATLAYEAKFQLVPVARGRASLCLQAAGLGVFRAPIPDRMFA